MTASFAEYYVFKIPPCYCVAFIAVWCSMVRMYHNIHSLPDSGWALGLKFCGWHKVLIKILRPSLANVCLHFCQFYMYSRFTLFMIPCSLNALGMLNWWVWVIALNHRRVRFLLACGHSFVHGTTCNLVLCVLLLKTAYLIGIVDSLAPNSWSKAPQLMPEGSLSRRRIFSGCQLVFRNTRQHLALGVGATEKSEIANEAHEREDFGIK